MPTNKTASTALIWATLLGTACSSASSAGEGTTPPPGSLDADAGVPYSLPGNGVGGAGADPLSPDGPGPNGAGGNPVGAGGVPGGVGDDVPDDVVAGDDDVPDGADDDVVVEPEDCTPGLVPGTSQFPRLLNREYDAAIRDLLGVTSLAAASGGPPSTLLVPDHDGAMDQLTWDAYLNVAETIAIEVMAGANSARFIDCDPALVECLRSTIETFGRKAFRRPLSEEETERLLSLADIEPQGTPTQVAETILFAFLSSPLFITLPEVTEDVVDANGVFTLSQHELATRLSLLVWGSIPDDELNLAVDAGQLGTPELVREQAARMVSVREKAGPQFVGVHRHYAGISSYSRWGGTDHDSMKYPAFASLATVAPAMMAELDAFFEALAYEGTFSDLFKSRAAFVNQATAPIYGLDTASFGAELERVEFEEGTRPGFLTRVGFLASFSSYAATSPTQRGAYISTQFLGVNPGPADPEALDVPAPDGTFLTQREYIQAFTASASCNACHTIIDAPGFVLEVYDAVGGEQSIDPLGGPIDGTADVVFPGDVMKTITSPDGLMNEIAALPESRRLYAERWVSFATRREPNAGDACIVDSLAEKLSDDAYPIKDVVLDLSQAPSFNQRTRVSE